MEAVNQLWGCHTHITQGHLVLAHGRSAPPALNYSSLSLWLSLACAVSLSPHSLYALTRGVSIPWEGMEIVNQLCSPTDETTLGLLGKT